MRSFRKKKTQSVVEYAIAFVVVAVGIIAIGFLANARGVFQSHFDDAMREMHVGDH